MSKAGGEWQSAPIYINAGKYQCNVAAPDKFRIGCQIRTHDEWREHWREIAKEHSVSDADAEIYIDAYNFTAKRMGWPILEEVPE